MSQSILLLTPPFTQLNTPYPATAYIKGFLNTLDISAFQVDLGIQVIGKIFSQEGLQQLFGVGMKKSNKELSPNAERIIALQEEYIATINPVIQFLRHKNPTLAYTICESDFLPQAFRFEQLDDLEWAFGTMGTQDKARHLATLYLEDLGDFIQEVVDSHFGFSRYAERLGRSAVSFDPIQEALEQPLSYIDELLIRELDHAIAKSQPNTVCISVPFPGNLYGALRCGQYLKTAYPHIKIVMGGGYPNTELRSLKEKRVFDYVDFITLDDGERPLVCLLEYLDGHRELAQLKRTFAIFADEVHYLNGAVEPDIPFSKTGTPDYSDLKLDHYLSVIEIANPMHRLWSDGRWNKLTMAHGCYWRKCSFCDITLDYIKNYDPLSAVLICDRIETLVQQTGETGFHFVDEAAPPALMREVALEILRRNLKITWWTNIRFEERFTFDLCRLLQASGCIAVSGGLEVASDRLLIKMQKGVTVSQVARVARNFTESGIMVHAYLMYGFPTQTAQETIDSLDMVRQLFELNVLQSGFWHLFAMTSHAPIGIDPMAFEVLRTGPELGTFADNDLSHADPSGTDHERFGAGLKKALFNYMHGIGFDFPLQEWFDFKIPKPSVPTHFIQHALEDDSDKELKPSHKAVWLGNYPELVNYQFTKKGKLKIGCKLMFHQKSFTASIKVSPDLAPWLVDILSQLKPRKGYKPLSLQQMAASYEKANFGDFQVFTGSEVWSELQEAGLIWV